MLFSGSFLFSRFDSGAAPELESDSLRSPHAHTHTQSLLHRFQVVRIAAAGVQSAFFVVRSWVDAPGRRNRSPPAGPPRPEPRPASLALRPPPAPRRSQLDPTSNIRHLGARRPRPRPRPPPRSYYSFSIKRPPPPHTAHDPVAPDGVTALPLPSALRIGFDSARLVGALCRPDRRRDGTG